MDVGIFVWVIWLEVGCILHGEFDDHILLFHKSLLYLLFLFSTTIKQNKTNNFLILFFFIEVDIYVQFI